MNFVSKTLLPWLIKIIKPELEKAIKALVAAFIALIIAQVIEKIKEGIERWKKYEKQADEADRKAEEAEASDNKFTAEELRKEAVKLREIAKAVSEELNDLKYKVEAISKNALKDAETRIGGLELGVDGERIALNIPVETLTEGSLSLELPAVESVDLIRRTKEKTAIFIEEPFTVVLPLLGQFRVRVTGLPPNLSSRDIHRDQYDDRTFAVPHTMGTIWCDVFNAEDDSFVAHAAFGSDGHAVRCDTVSVEQKYRRKGVASALYNLASYIFETPVKPSTILSTEAKSFWSGRTEILCADIDHLTRQTH